MTTPPNWRARFWPEPDPEPTLASWRASLTKYTIRVLLISATALQAILFASFWPGPIPGTTLLPSAVFPLALLALAFARSTRTRATIILAGFWSVSPILFAAFGPSATGFIPLLTACVLASVLIGPRTAVAFMGASVVSVVAGALLHQNGWLLPHANGNAHIRPVLWFRMGLIWLACTSWVVYVTSWITARFERALAQKDRAIEEARVAGQRSVASEQRRQDTESALIEAQKHEALGRLASGVSHDFNNALFVILGWNDLLSREEVTPEQRRQAHQAISTAARNAAELAKRLVAMSRERPGPPHLTRLQPVIADAIRVLGRLLPDDIRVSSEVHDVPPISIDGSQLQQVLFNLALHARDAMPQGGRLAVLLASETDPERGSYAVIRVRDTGPGLATEETAKADAGITAARAIVERAGGDMVRVVEAGRGGEWCVRFPIPGEAGHEHVPATRLAGRTARILVVEDDDAVRDLIVVALRAFGHQVREAADGDIAMEMLADGQCEDDLLCIDGVLPGAPSTAIIDRFRVVRPGRPVLVCSGHLASPQLQSLIQTERLPFLGKPFTPEELLRRIDLLLGERPALAGN